MQPEIRRLGQMETTKLDLGGNAQRVVQIEFMVDREGPFTVDVPKEQYDAETVAHLVNEYAERVRGVSSVFDRGPAPGA